MADACRRDLGTNKPTMREQANTGREKSGSLQQEIGKWWGTKGLDWTEQS